MSDLFPESEPDVVRFLPDETEPLSGQEALDRLQDALELDADSIDLIVSEPAPQPIGRSWAFDFSAGRFVTPPTGGGPARTYGIETLRPWCEKALMTSRGAHPIHPPGYGLTGRENLIGGPVTSPPLDLEGRIEYALTFHPRVAGLANFAAAFDRDEDWIDIAFDVLTDDGSSVEVRGGTVA
jgi:hypothetical protein